jgi:hypothetical protein
MKMADSPIDTTMGHVPAVGGAGLYATSPRSCLAAGFSLPSLMRASVEVVNLLPLDHDGAKTCHIHPRKLTASYLFLMIGVKMITCLR